MNARLGQMVAFRHPELRGIILPALVVATPDSYAALSDGDLSDAGIWNFPGFHDLEGEDHGLVHLVVFTPSNRDPSRVHESLGHLAAPCFVAANVPYSETAMPGTWGAL